MSARNRFLVVLSFGVVVTVASLVALYGREELLARESAVSQSETVAAAAVAVAETANSPLASGGDFQAAAALNSQLVKIQLANPRIRQITVLVAEGGDTYRVAADIGLVPDKLRPGTTTTLGEEEASRAKDSVRAVSTWRSESVTTWAPLLQGGRPRGLARVEFDATGIGSGVVPVLFVLSLGLVVTLVLVVFVSRSIGRRLNLLLDGTSRLAQGDLAHRVEVRGHDEISELAESFNAMADALEDNRSSLGNAIAELGQTSALVEARAKENESLLTRTVEAVDGERRRLATELHDSTIQSLQSIGMLAEYAQMLMEREQYDEAQDRVDSMRQRLNDAIAELRRLLFDLRPPNLDDTGLAAALELRLNEVSELGELETHLDIADSIEIPRELETVIYRFCQEALSNVVRHSDATKVDVRVWRQGDNLRVTVEDNGKGFKTDTEPERGHFGLQGMKERANLAGGTLILDSRLGSKTRVELSLPIRSQTDDADQPSSSQLTSPE